MAVKNNEETTYTVVLEGITQLYIYIYIYIYIYGVQLYRIEYALVCYTMRVDNTPTVESMIATLQL